MTTGRTYKDEGGCDLRKTGLYKIVGKGPFALDDLKVKLTELNVRDPQLVIEQIDKFGRWTDGKIRILAIR